MSALLVATANWAFTDGTLGVHGGEPHVARAWLRAIRRAAIRSGFGRDGLYRPLSALDIVCAGDTFDCLASIAWRGRVRPWQGSARAREAHRGVLEGCMRRATALLAGLARLLRQGVAVPAADGRGRPAAATAVRLPVRIAVLPGDRDRCVGEMVREIARHGATVAPAWSDGMVFVRHGHDFDPACHVEARSYAADRPPTLSESVAVDLVAAFATGLVGRGAARRSHAALVTALSAAGPAAVPVVFNAWLAPGGPGAGLDRTARSAIVSMWRHAVDAWLREARRVPPECGIAASPLESLAGWFASTAETTLPEPLGILLKGVAPRECAAPAGVGLRVLGHQEPPAGDASTVCLGRPPVRRWGPIAVIHGGVPDVACVAHRPLASGPATVVCRRRDPDRVEWERLPPVGAPEHEITAVDVLNAA